jgi:hypothetical protein
MKYAPLTLSEKQVRILLGIIDMYKSILRDRGYPINGELDEVEKLNRYLCKILFELEVEDV